MTRGDDNTVVLWRGTGEPWRGANYGTVLQPFLEKAGYAVIPIDYMDPAADLEQALNAKRHVLTGSSTSVHTTTPRMSHFFSTLETILERALRGDATVAGVCFGSQAIARVLGGPDAVVESENGLDIGVGPVFTVPERGAEAESYVTSHFHYEEIGRRFLSTPGVQHLYKSQHTEVQGFRVGASIVAYQFHADFSPPCMRALVEYYTDLLDEFGLDRKTVLQSVETNEKLWDEEFLRATVLEPLASVRGD